MQRALVFAAVFGLLCSLLTLPMGPPGLIVGLAGGFGYGSTLLTGLTNQPGWDSPQKLRRAAKLGMPLPVVFLLTAILSPAGLFIAPVACIPPAFFLYAAHRNSRTRGEPASSV